MRADDKRHGEMRGYDAHLNAKPRQKPCEPCAEAMRKERRGRSYLSERASCWRCGVSTAARDKMCPSCRFHAAQPIGTSPDHHALGGGEWVPDGKGVLRWVWDEGKPPEEPEPLRHRPAPLLIAKCGTDGGYYRHIRTLREKACDDCLEGHRVADRERAANNRLRKRMELQDGAA